MTSDLILLCLEWRCPSVVFGVISSGLSLLGCVSARCSLLFCLVSHLDRLEQLLGLQDLSSDVHLIRVVPAPFKPILNDFLFFSSL